MILPILSYGNSILKKKAIPISINKNILKNLIINMWDTMYALGVGLVNATKGEPIRLFIADTSCR